MQNDIQLREELDLPETEIKTDSYIAVQVLEKYGELSEYSLAQTAEKILGSFVFTFLDSENNSYFVRGNNPLALYKFKAGFYIYASTELILDAALLTLGILDREHEKTETHIGDIIKIDKDGNLSKSTFDVPDDEYYCLRNFDFRSLFIGESQQIRQLKNYANTIGIDPEDIDMLLDYGYDPDDIEDLICEPGAFQEAVYVSMEFGYGDDPQ